MRMIYQFTVLALAVATLTGSAVAAEPATSNDFSFATYRERTDDVTMIVGTFLASQREQDPYIPVPVAIGLYGKKGDVIVTPESFVLVDSAGNRYPAASFQEIRQHYDKLAFDRTVLRKRPLVIGSEFAVSRRVQANFFPAASGGLRTERVWLAPFTWFTDVIYFPRPDRLDGTLRLEFKPQGLAQTVTARIAVPGLASKVMPAREES